MNVVTRILSTIEQDDPQAAYGLLPLVHGDLRRLAARRLMHEAPRQALKATALIRENTHRLVDAEQDRDLYSRGHFSATAAEATRRALIGRVLDGRRLEPGGGWQWVDFGPGGLPDETPGERLLAPGGVSQRLERDDPVSANLVR